MHQGTAVLGLLGYPVHHSQSPLMHNAVFHKMGIPAVYLPFEVNRKQLAQAVQGIKALGFRGVNVTIPFKEAVIDHLDRLSPEAELYQAVNVIACENNELVGYNTDGSGFMSALKEAGISPAGKCVLMGAGGAARSISIALAQAGAGEIVILDLDQPRALSLAETVRDRCPGAGSTTWGGMEAFADVARSADLIVNCTPAGMYPRGEESPVGSLQTVSPRAVICDIIYNPLETRLLAMAREMGLQTMNGLPMFVHQGALTLKILLGIDAPVEFMKEVVEGGLQTEGSNPD